MLPHSRLASATLSSMLLIAVMLLLPLRVTGQEKEPAAQQGNREAAFALYRQHKIVEALPLFEELALTNPNDAAIWEGLGFCRLLGATALPSSAERRAMRVRAREAFLHSQELGNNSNFLQNVLGSLPADGTEVPYSQRKDVQEAMMAGEAAFARGDFDEALQQYQVAVALDPTDYNAPLFIGDVYYKRGDTEEAGKWFALAIRNDPNRETAYRYWGDALKTAGRTSEARARFIEAVIAEPYNRNSWVGIMQWADDNKVQLAHPRIESPNRVERKDDKTINITIDAESMKKKDGTSAWMIYDLSRAAWQGERFKKEFPSEPAYRHTLQEEAESLRAVVGMVEGQKKDKKIKNLEPGLAALLELEAKGLLEAYVLFARADEGIAKDYDTYRQENRDKLRRYLDDYVVPRVE